MSEMNSRYNKEEIQYITATKILPPDIDGSLYLLDVAAGATITLPRLNSGKIRTTIKFIVKTAPSGGDYVITEDVRFDTNTIVTGINELEVDTSNDGPYSAGHTTITFGSTAVIGDYVVLEKGGANWYCVGQTNVDGAITLA